jgi:hypothetical protein
MKRSALCVVTVLSLLVHVRVHSAQNLHPGGHNGLQAPAAG